MSNNSKFSIICCDTETTGLDYLKNEIIEVSFYRLNDDVQRTWFIKPTDYENIQVEALRINGHKIEDLKHLTKEGKERYKDPAAVLVEIENWLMEDASASEDKILVGQNIVFDLQFLQALWAKYNNSETFPFGNRPRLLDTMQIELFLDLKKGERSEYYNLSSLVEKWGVKRERAHAAACDTRMTKNVFLAQCNYVKKFMSNENIVRS